MDKKDIIIYILMVLLIFTIGVIGYFIGKEVAKEEYRDIPIYSEIYTLDNESTLNMTNNTIE